MMMVWCDILERAEFRRLGRDEGAADPSVAALDLCCGRGCAGVRAGRNVDAASRGCRLFFAVPLLHLTNGHLGADRTPPLKRRLQ